VNRVTGKGRSIGGDPEGSIPGGGASDDALRRVARSRGFFKEAGPVRYLREARRLLGWASGLLLAVVLALAAGRAPLAAQAPDAEWRTFSTQHIRVTYTPPLEPLARRAAARAERAWTRLDSLFLDGPSGTVDLLLSDHTDLSNGFAQVTPDKRITVFASPPVDDLDLGYFDEWIELVVTHEVVHIFHLDRAGRLGRFLRSIFGRVPGRWPFFPGFDLPRWGVEGMATWYESELTEAGRVEGTFQESMLRTAILEDRFERIDQASGTSPVWPSGTRPYVYGSRFFEYLLEKHGRESMSDFAEAVAGQWIPYRLNSAGSNAFGAPLSEEWAAWRESLEERWSTFEEELRRHGPVTRPEVVTRGSRQALYPQIGPHGRLAYTRGDGRSDPQLRVSPPGGEGSGTPGRKLLQTNSLGTFAWLADGDLVLGQSEFVDPYRSYGDLYRVDGRSGAARRLTRGLRLSYPSPVPGEERVVAVQEGEGSATLVQVSLADGTVEALGVADSLVHWTAPAVSPDGRWVAASRWSPGARLDVVVLERSTGEVMARITDDRAMDLFPAWSPDGRWLLWASDRTGIHNLVARPMDPATGRPTGPLRLATNLPTSAAYPSVTGDEVPGGPWVYFSGYHADGWDVERIPFDPAGWPEAPPPAPRFTPARTPAPEVDPNPSLELLQEPQSYSPLPTLAPRHWEPLYEEPIRSRPIRRGDLVVPTRTLLRGSIGAETTGRDLVGRHRYSAFARWHLGGGGRVDGGLSWSWAGLGNPILAVGVNQFWGTRGARLAGTFPGEPFDTLYLLERERGASLGVTFLRTRVRSRASLALSAGWVREAVEYLDASLEVTDAYRLNEAEGDRMDLRVTASWSNLRSYAFQMGPSDGVSLLLRGRTRLDLDRTAAQEGRLGFDGSLDDVQGRVSLFRSLGGPGYSSHVLALQASGGYARGPGAGPGHFLVGGASGRTESVSGLSLFGGRSIFFPVRGYDTTARFGRSAWSVAGEYRFPIALVHRGLGTWPLHLDRVSGVLFADAGNAWGPELDRPGYDNPPRDPLASVGGEVLADVLTLWSEPLRLRTGFAVPLVDGDGVRAYLRLGFAF